MKHSAIFLMILLLPFLLTACGDKDDQSQNPNGFTQKGLDINISSDYSKEVTVTSSINNSRNTKTAFLITKEKGEFRTIYQTQNNSDIRKPLWSPNGKKIAFKVADYNTIIYWKYKGLNTCDIYVWNAETGNAQKLDWIVALGRHTDDEQFFYCWSDDSSKLLFQTGPIIAYWDAQADKIVEISDEAQTGVSAGFLKDQSGIAFTAFDDNGFYVYTYDFSSGKASLRVSIPLEGSTAPEAFNPSGVEFTARTPMLAVYSDTNLICYGNSAYYRVNLANGSYQKLFTGLVYAGQSTTHRYIVFRSMDIPGELSIYDAVSKEFIYKWTQNYYFNPVWNRDDTQLIVWSVQEVKVIDLKGNLLLGPYKPAGSSAPAFTKDGIWYDTSDDTSTTEEITS